MLKKSTFLPVAAVVLSLPAGAHAGAAPPAAGALDPAFGTGGMVTAVPNAAFIGDAKLQPNRRILVISAIQNLNLATRACGIVRFLPNGALDTSFGAGGVVETAPFSNFINTPYDLAIQPDGKIVVAGNGQSADGSVNPLFLTRVDSAGHVDRGFGNAGVVIDSFAKFDIPQVVLLQSDGKIIVGGYALPADDEQPQQAILARYNSDGTPDAGFGTAGRVVGLLGTITALALQADGKILANNGSPFLRVLADGTIDGTDTGGTVVASAHTGTGMFLPNGTFAVAGTAVDFDDRHDIDVQMMRDLQTGAPDPGFVSPPIDLGPEGPHAVSYIPVSIAAQADGKLLTAVPVTDPSFRQDFGTARFNADGSVDTGFGSGGQVVTAFAAGNGSEPFTMFVQPDGKIVVVGLTLPNTVGGNKLQLVRYIGR